MSATDLRREITQLEEERGQLIDKIAGLKKRTADIVSRPRCPARHARSRLPARPPQPIPCRPTPTHVQPGFGALLEATSQLRLQQEEEGRLAERMAEQRAALAAAERRYADVNRRLAETRAGAREDMTADQLLDALRKEVTEGRTLARKSLPASLEARRDTLARLQRTLMEPAKSEDDLFALKAAVASAEEAVARLTMEVAAQQRAAGDDKLAMFRQQSALIAKKLQQKEEAAEVAGKELDTINREIEAKVSRGGCPLCTRAAARGRGEGGVRLGRAVGGLLSRNDARKRPRLSPSQESKLSELSGPRYMRRDEFNAYAATLRAKTQTFKALKQQMADIRGETVVLARTEQVREEGCGLIAVHCTPPHRRLPSPRRRDETDQYITGNTLPSASSTAQLLKSRAGDLAEFLRRLEERKGVSGYTVVQRCRR